MGDGAGVMGDLAARATLPLVRREEVPSWQVMSCLLSLLMLAKSLQNGSGSYGSCLPVLMLVATCSPSCVDAIPRQVTVCRARAVCQVEPSRSRGV